MCLIGEVTEYLTDSLARPAYLCIQRRRSGSDTLNVRVWREGGNVEITGAGKLEKRMYNEAYCAMP